jgi:hypothetical protein
MTHARSCRAGMCVSPKLDPSRNGGRGGDGKECGADFRGSFRLMVRVCESVGIIVMERN